MLYEKTQTGFSAYSPDLDGCIATGATREEVEKTMREAIRFYLEGLKEEHLPIPKPHCFYLYRNSRIRFKVSYAPKKWGFFWFTPTDIKFNIHCRKERTQMKRLMIVVLVIVLGAASLAALYKYKNQPPRPDYFEVYKTQDTVPEGKVGVFVISLIMPEDHDHVLFYNIFRKVTDTIIPWPFRLFALRDKGIALMDPANVYATEDFVPETLEDAFGNDRDRDGTPYIEKYRQGLVQWQPPSNRIWLDNGYFIYTGRKGGEPSLCGKIACRSRIHYYGSGNVQKKFPHWRESFNIINTVFDRLRLRYEDIEFRAETSMFYYDARKKMFELLDAGCDTIVLASLMPIYSHFEDFNGGFKTGFTYIAEWQKQNPGKPIKVIMAPQMGNFQPLRQAFLEMLKDRLDLLPQDANVAVVLSTHGMPWDNFPHEAWLQLAPAYLDELYAEAKQLLESYRFGRTKIVNAQDQFADPIWDPDNRYLSTNQAYWDAIHEGYDYVIGLPVDFIAENSDTMISHAKENFYMFDDFDIYDPVDYPDWSVPYTREIVQDSTRVIYNGVPVGKYQKHVIEAFYQSIDSVLSAR